MVKTYLKRQNKATANYAEKPSKKFVQQSSPPLYIFYNYALSVSNTSAK